MSLEIWAIGALAASALVVSAIVVIMKNRRSEEEGKLRQEQAMRARVREKAEEAVALEADAHEDFLSNSGVLSVLQMMDALASGGNYAEAEKWAFNAIQNQPNQIEIPLKLAEIYYQGRRKKAFVALAEKLSNDPAAMPPGAWDNVILMGRELAPDHPLFDDASHLSLAR